jgi:P-type E1-E2 ATPase
MANCIHCDEPILCAVFNDDDRSHNLPFCCYGCLTVSNILHQKGLESYYEIKKQSAIFKRRSPVETKNDSYQFLDDADFLNEYSYLNLYGEKTMEFYLEGIHCLACLWLIEKMPEFLTTVITSKLDLDRSVVTVVLKTEGRFSQVARELNQLGYRPHPLKKNQDSAVLKVKEERLALIRIGVAGAAAGNIMIYAVSLYGGASENFAQVFNALTVFFAIPVLTFCAYPFYQNAWNALKNRTLSIDIPISIALIVGAIMGLYNLVLKIPENYFDSLTTLVFLLLLSRYFLQKIQERGLSAHDLHFFYQSESVLKQNIDSASFTEIHPKFIKIHDVLKILPGEFIPADGVVLEGSSNLNNSLLTGESLPVKVKAGDKVFSGTQNIDREIIMRAEKMLQDTRLGSLLKNVENGWTHRSHMVDLTSRVSKYFTLAVFILSGLLFLYLAQTHTIHEALERAITLLIVTCPCALALATPLTFTRALSKASQQGIIIKSDEVLEKISKIENVFIDKTGTITNGKLQVGNFQVLKQSTIAVEEIIYNLEHKSRHPVSQALLDFIKGKFARSLEVSDYLEVLGVGVAGKINNIHYSINKHGIFENDILVATFSIEDSVRNDSKLAMSYLLSRKLNVKIISGDKRAFKS